MRAQDMKLLERLLGVVRDERGARNACARTMARILRGSVPRQCAGARRSQVGPRFEGQHVPDTFEPPTWRSPLHLSVHQPSGRQRRLRGFGVQSWTEALCRILLHSGQRATVACHSNGRPLSSPFSSFCAESALVARETSICMSGANTKQKGPVSSAFFCPAHRRLLGHSSWTSALGRRHA